MQCISDMELQYRNRLSDLEQQFDAKWKNEQDSLQLTRRELREKEERLSAGKKYGNK